MSPTLHLPALFRAGDFTLASGAKSKWKIEGDGLSPYDWDVLATMLMDFLPAPFGTVVGVPRGGVPFANALSRFGDPSSDTILVVDDVWTTGGSMERYIESESNYPRWFEKPIMRAVVFARNPAPPNVTALFTMPAKP